MAGVAYGVFAKGAFSDGQFAVLLVLCIAALCLELWVRVRSDSATLVVPCGFGLVVLAGASVSAVLTGSVGGALPTFGLIVVVVAGLVVGGAHRVSSEGVVVGLLACGVVVAATAWVGVAFHYTPWALTVEGLWRGASAITYSNAAAAFLTMMFLVAVGRLACAPDRSLKVVCWALAVGLVATMSRAGVAAMLVGLVVVGAGVGWGRLGRVLMSVVPGVVIAIAGLVPGLLSTSAARPVLAGVALVVGLGVVLSGRSVVASAALVALCALAVVVGAAGGFGGVPEQLGRTRLVVQSQDRGHEWRAAMGEFAASPVVGQGPGQATFAWRADDGRWMQARFAHNEYLELAATQGLVGVFALGAGSAFVVWHVRRRGGSRPGSPVDGYRIGAVGALAAFGLHSAFDFLWHVPVLALAAGLLGGFLLAPRDGGTVVDDDRETAPLPTGTDTPGRRRVSRQQFPRFRRRTHIVTIPTTSKTDLIAHSAMPAEVSKES